MDEIKKINLEADKLINGSMIIYKNGFPITKADKQIVLRLREATKNKLSLYKKRLNLTMSDTIELCLNGIDIDKEVSKISKIRIDRLKSRYSDGYILKDQHESL